MNEAFFSFAILPSPSHYHPAAASRDTLCVLSLSLSWKKKERTFKLFHCVISHASWKGKESFADPETSECRERPCLEWRITWPAPVSLSNPVRRGGFRKRSRVFSSMCAAWRQGQLAM
ncbi:hypothetical protein MUK42_21501 [Musa troglodytarum]|uniref:Uncharacterized protein n=1 Tax=Musa troglodytarum TaxID=320322 RepID=A0A9E7ICK6_9LILI|nr:hypothetical protein MUK42_21501 [Musa troglodytarum]